MSSIGGPNSIRDGLVLYVDAGNIKSFRGEPTVNLINNPLPSGTTNFIIGGGVGTATYEANEKAVRWLRTSYETWGAYYYNDSLSNYLFDTGSTYAISFEWKYGPTHNAGSTHYFDIIQGNGSNRIIGNFNLLTSSTLQDNGWYYFSKTGIPANAGITQTGQPAQFRLICGNITGKTTDIYWRELQFEKKSSPTPFVDGTRGTTVATGGGLIDLSKNSNNGELVNGPYYSSANSGSLIFDGVDDYISTGNIDLSTTNTVSVDFWCKLLSYPEVDGTGKVLFEFSTNFNPITTGFVVSYSDDGYTPLNNVFPVTLALKGDVGYNLRSYSKTLVNDLKWHHWHCIFDKSQSSEEVSLYIDGIKATVATIEFSNNNTNNFGNLPLFIGGRGATFNSNIQLSSFKIYNRALNQNEITQNYNASKSRFGL